MNVLTKKQFNIDDVASNTGLGKDTLRVWERRYGFPKPERSSAGERLYSLEQLERLRAICRLLDQGIRPGRVVGMSSKDLDELSKQSISIYDEHQDPVVGELIAAIEAGEVARSKGLILSQLVSRGPRDFIYQTLVPILNTVGNSWARGKLPIYQEHLITQQLMAVLTLVSDQIEVGQSKLRIVLTTIPGERHSLGLMMAEIMMRLEDVETVNLGVETPIDQQLQACHDLRPDVLALSFSSMQKRGPIISALTELSHKLPETIAIVVGGAGVAHIRKLPTRIQVIKNLDTVREIIRSLGRDKKGNG